MNKKKVSIIIPTYNNEEYLDKCLASISGKYESNVEILVIDDGSTDHTANIVKKYIYHYNNIHYFYQKNSGVSVARNIGLEKATGEYIFFLDSDDYMSKNGISQLIKYADGQNDLIVFPYALVGDNGFKDDQSEGEETVIVKDCDKIIKSALIGETVISSFSKQDMRSSCSKLIKSEIIRKNNIRFDKNIDIAEDMVFMLHVYEYIEKVLFVNTIVYLYFKNNNSAINSYHPNYINNILKVDSNVDRVIKGKSRELYTAFNFYKLNDIILYLKYDIFNKQNQDTRIDKYKKINDFLKKFEYEKIFNSVKHSEFYKNIKIKQKIIYKITIWKLFIIDEVIFNWVYR